MQTKIDVSVTPTGSIRLAITEPANAPDDPKLMHTRHWDIALLPALMLASQLINATAMLLHSAAKRQRKAEAAASDGMTSAEVGAADPTSREPHA